MILSAGNAARYLVALWLALIGCCAHATPNAGSSSLCKADRCGLLVDGAYSNLVIGKTGIIGTSTDMHKVYHWAKTHGYWKSLPATIEPYLRDIKLVTIIVPHSLLRHPVTVFMQQDEFAAATFHAGDLIRYSPHDAEHEAASKGNAEDLALFHGLSGCIEVLCRKGDITCFKRYPQGAFTITHGEQINLATGALMPHGIRIDPISLLPID
jgi:hypothetical protein